MTCICGREHEPFLIDGQEIENTRQVLACEDEWKRESEASDV